MASVRSLEANAASKEMGVLMRGGIGTLALVLLRMFVALGTAGRVQI